MLTGIDYCRRQGKSGLLCLGEIWVPIAFYSDFTPLRILVRIFISMRRNCTAGFLLSMLSGGPCVFMNCPTCSCTASGACSGEAGCQKMVAV